MVAHKYALRACIYNYKQVKNGSDSHETIYRVFWRRSESDPNDFAEETTVSRTKITRVKAASCGQRGTDEGNHRC